uniref:Uncharacterized protein n=1 Tax=candidate division WOR-3 bacterium TaxID=2052148 RepID=A0A7V0Z675_UNCW3
MLIVKEKIDIGEIKRIAAEDFMGFDVLINLRPAQGNKSSGVDDPALRKRIVDIVYNLIAK